MYNQKCNEMPDSCHEQQKNGAYLDLYLHDVRAIKHTFYFFVIDFLLL